MRQWSRLTSDLCRLSASPCPLMNWTPASPLAAFTVEMDGTVVTPEGWFGLDEMEIECESSVHVARDEDGNPTGAGNVFE